MLSAHLDSWDAGSGATDNGTGTITMLEAMRILKTAYPNPKRTILVGHWSGEEEGDIGSSAFAADHPEILKGLQALFNQDNGTGEIDSVQTNGFIDAAPSLARWMSRMPADLTKNVALMLPGSRARREHRQRRVRLPRRAGVLPVVVGLVVHGLHLAHQPRHLRQGQLRRGEAERDAGGDVRVPGVRGSELRLARAARAADEPANRTADAGSAVRPGAAELEGRAAAVGLVRSTGPPIFAIATPAVFRSCPPARPSARGGPSPAWTRTAGRSTGGRGSCG